MEFNTPNNQTSVMGIPINRLRNLEIAVASLQQAGGSVITRKDTLANLILLKTGNGELTSATDGPNIVQLNGTNPTGTAAVFSPMARGIWTDTTFTLKSPDGTGTGTPANGKNLNLIAGQNAATAGTAGTLNLTGGANIKGTGNAGSVLIKGGASNSGGNGGNLQMLGGNAGSNTGNVGGTLILAGGHGDIGGSVQFAGAAGATTPGDMFFLSASSDDGTVFGNILFQNADSEVQLQITYDNKIAFFGVTPIVQPTVTGSRATGAALVSLLSALASLGLIINSTTT